MRGPRRLLSSSRGLPSRRRRGCGAGTGPGSGPGRARQHGHAEREEQHRAVDLHLLRPRREARGELDERVARGYATSRPTAPPTSDEQRALRQQLSQQAARGRRRAPRARPARVSRADRRASVRFATFAQAISSTRPTVPSSTSSVGRACAHHLLAHGHETRGGVDALRVGVRVLLLQRARPRSPRPPAPLERHPGPHPRERLACRAPGDSPSCRARPERAGGGGHVDVVLVGIAGQRRQHAHHRVHAVVHLEPAADHARVAAQLVLPVRVAQHAARLRAERVLPGRKVRPRIGSHAQHLEEGAETTPVRTRCGCGPPSSMKFIEWYSTTLQRLASARRSPPPPSPRSPCPPRSTPQRLAGGPRTSGAALVGQRAQQHAVHDAEDRGVGADAERQRQRPPPP